VTFDLTRHNFKPYSKPGNIHQYVHQQSNHPPIITKRIPQSIEARLSSISSNTEIFNSAKAEYEHALNKAGYNSKLQYKPNNNSNQQKKKNRKRNITWYNPPYSMNVKTNIGKSFLTLIEKHFPNTNILHKIFNKNTIKISYSCMNNMDHIIKAHNNRIINSAKPIEPDRCNCRNKATCPLPNRCTTKNIIYKAIVTTDETQKNYIGLTSNTFKTRYNSHKATFTDIEKRNSTELSKYIWKLKEKNTPYEIKWNIIQHAQPYSPATKRCNLCLAEKYHIITADRNNTLNSKSELISTCRHRKKCLLSEYG